MTAPVSQARDVALDYQREQQNFANAAADVAGQMWDGVDPNNIAASWRAQVPELTGVVSGAQLGAARQADPYTDDVLAAQDLGTESVGAVNPPGFAGTASDGRGLASLLTNPVVVTLLTISDGVDVARALLAGRSNLTRLVHTQVSDAGRLSTQTSLTAHPGADGYVRVAVGNSCARCLILAGREYRWNRGFQRHPKCDCVHLPTRTAGAAGLIQDPAEIYGQMSRAERMRAGFTLADQRALAEGADITQIVNARHRPGALRTADGRRPGSRGRSVFTTEGTTRRGFFGGAAQRQGRATARLTPDEIFATATSREDAVRLLRENRYLLSEPPVRPQILATGPGGGAAVPGAPSQVRRILQEARYPSEVSGVLAAELRRITGRDVVVDLRGSVVTAREHAEGVLRVAERYPDLPVKVVRTGQTRRAVSYAETWPPPRGEIIFNERWSDLSQRRQYLAATAEDSRRGFHPRGTGDPVGVAVHEASHLLDPMTQQLDEALAAVVRGQRIEDISGYATRNGREMVAEAFADVVTNGSASAPLSRAVVQTVEAHRGRGLIGRPPLRPLPSTPDLSGLPVTRLRAMVRQAGITVPTGIRKPALARLAQDLEDGVAAAVARQRAVRSILEEREAVAGALVDAAEMVANESSERALRHLANSIRNRFGPEVLPTLRPLIDALDAADLARVQAAIPVVARGANLRPIGEIGGVVRFDTKQMEFIGSSRGATVQVVRPGFETTFERQVTVLRRAAVQPTTAPIPAKMAPRKAAKKAAPPAAEPRPAVVIDRTADPAEIVAQEERARRAALEAPDVRLPDMGQRSQRALALRGYQRHGDENMNGLLRTGRVRKAEGQKVAPTEAEVRASIQQIDDAMAASVLSEPIVVYRGLATPTGIFRGEPGSAVGRTFTEKGFSSTSASRRQAMHWSSGEVGDAGVVLEVRVPAGTRAVTLSDEDFIGNAPTRISEQEVLLERGLTYRVVSDEVIGDAYVSGGVGAFSDSYRHIVVEVVPAGAPAKAAAKAAPAKKATPRKATAPSHLRKTEPDPSVSSTSIVPTPTPPNPQSWWGQIRDDPRFTWSEAHGRPGNFDQVDRVYTAPTAEDARQFVDSMTPGRLRNMAEAADIDMPPVLTVDSRAELIDRIVASIREPERVVAVRAARKVAAPKAPPAPDKMTAPALRTELQRTLDAVPVAERIDLAQVPKPVLAAWTRRIRELPAAEHADEVARWRLAVIERQRSVAELLAEADELLDNGASATALGSRGRGKLRQIEAALKGWPGEASARSVVTAMATGNPTSIRRALRAAEKKLGLRRIGDQAGTVARKDASMSSLGGRIPDGAPVRVVRPGYEVEIGGQRVVLSRPVVEPATGRDIGLPSRDVPSLRELLDAAPTGKEYRAARARLDGPEFDAWRLEQTKGIADGVDGTYAGLRVQVDVPPLAIRSGETGFGGTTEGAIGVTGKIFDSSGREVGRFSRTVTERNGELVAVHERLELDRRLQGSGFAEEFNANLYDWYRRSGVTRVELTANIDVGGYAWARKGFDFADARAARDFVEEATETVEKAIAKVERTGRLPRGITEQDLRALRKYLNDIESGRIPAHAPEIAEFGRQPGQSGKRATWPGKWLLLGSSWRGVLHL